MGKTRLRIEDDAWQAFDVPVEVVDAQSTDERLPQGTNVAPFSIAMFKDMTVQAKEADTASGGNDRARQLALAAHRRATAIDSLPRFSIRGSHATYSDITLPNSSNDPVENLSDAIQADVGDAHAFRYFNTFAWDEHHWLQALQAFDDGFDDPNDPGFGSLTARGNIQWADEQRAAECTLIPGEPARHVLMNGSADLWPQVTLSNPNYLLIGQHRFRWGANNDHRKYVAGTSVPSEDADFSFVTEESIDGEMCHVIDSVARMERLWISQRTGLIICCVKYSTTKGDPDFYKSDALAEIVGRRFTSQSEYGDWYRKEYEQLPQVKRTRIIRARAKQIGPEDRQAGLMVRFSDFREIAPGIHWPFVEERVQGAGGSNGNMSFMRISSRVVDVRTDIELKATVEQLQPKAGDRIQDQRFKDRAIVNYTYRDDMTAEHVKQLVDVEHQKRMKDQAYLSTLLKPLDDLVGKPVPELPEDGWVGGQRPDVRGRPYLIHYWATWCGRCKNDLPALKRLVKNGQIVVGLHPAGTPREDVEEAQRSGQLNYPTFLEPGDSTIGGTIGGLPSGVFPYALLVDANGKVVAHGRLHDEKAALISRLHELAE
ncbi:MAG: hypothetical protein R3C49_24440 [Planctomycetaceae bacterium]